MLQVLRTLAITLLVAGLLGGGLWFISRGTTGLPKRAATFMEQWWEGEPVEGAFARGFADAASGQGLEKLRVFWKSQLGPYLGPGEVIRESISERTGALVMVLHFEKQDATARFQFVEEGGELKIESFRLDIPRQTGPDSTSSGAQSIATRVLELWATSETQPIREMFTAELRRSLPAGAFAERTASTLKRLGTLKRVEFISREDDGDEQVRMVFNVVFSSGAHEARLTLLWRGARWNVHAFHAEGLE